MTTDVAPDSRKSRFRIPYPRTVSGVVKVLLVVVLVTFLFIYVGPTVIWSTTLKIVIAVAISAALFVGANLLFNNAYTHWNRFATIAGFITGFVVFLLVAGNRAMRSFGSGPWLWALVGGLAVGAVMFLLTTPTSTLARLPLATVGLGGVGLLLAIGVSADRQPGLDWTKLLICTGVGIALSVGRRAVLAKKSATPDKLLQSALIGGSVGWLIGAWGGATFRSVDAATGEVVRSGGNIAQAIVATVIPFAAVGVAIGLRHSPDNIRRREIEQKSRAWIFIVPALSFIAGGLIVPLLRTVVESFQANKADGYVGFQNYYNVITSKNFFDMSNWDWPDFFGSRLFWITIALLAAAAITGVVAGRRVRRPFESTPGSTIALIAAFFFISCLVLATLRGSIVNNVWWVIVVTLLATSFGLGVAVLADRARGENVAKALIFLPMAISFVGAGVIWTLIYKPRNINKQQSGVLNAIWVGLGQLSASTWQKWIVFTVMIAIVAFCGYVAFTGIKLQNYTRSGFSIGVGCVVLFLALLLVTRGIGFEIAVPPVQQRDLPGIPDYVRTPPYNNMFLMVVLIWIQTGFAMVILSSAIKAVPTEYLEAAAIDGATESQTFWRVTLPQLMPTIAVVVTTTIVTVMKVYDIIQVMTGGQNGTQVIAFQMIEQINFANSASASTYATLLFIAILPVMVYNIRNMRKEG